MEESSQARVGSRLEGAPAWLRMQLAEKVRDVMLGNLSPASQRDQEAQAALS